MSQSEDTRRPSVPTVELELEHAVAYSAVQGTLHYHPNGFNYIHTAGAAIVINDLKDSHKQEFLQGHDDTITCLAISTSGRFLASGQKGRNADVCVWNFHSRELLYRLAEHDHGIAAVGFSDDEMLLATAGVAEDKKLIVWDLTTGNVVTSAAGNPCPTTTLRWAGFVKDVKRRNTHMYLLCTAGAHQVVHWAVDAHKGAIAGDRVSAEGRVTLVRQVTCVCFSEDREYMLAGTTTGDFAVVSNKERKLRKTVSACRGGVLSLVAWGHPQSWLLVGGGDGSLSLFDPNFIKQKHVDLKGGVVSLSFGPQKLEVLAGTDRGFVYRVRVDVEALSLTHILVSENHSAAVRGVQYAKEASDRFATCSDDCTIRVWDVSDYSVIASVNVRDAGRPLCLVCSLDLLLTGWEDGQVRAFDTETGRSLWAIPNAHKAGVTSISMSHNQRFILTGGQQGDIRLWELRSRDLVSHLKGHHLSVTSIVIYADDLHAVSVSADRSVICWDLRTEKRVSTHVQRMGGLNSVELSPDETLLVTAGQERRMTFWDLREQEPLLHREMGDDEAKAVALSPDGRLIVTGGTGKVVKVWDLITATLLTSAPGRHSGTITDLRFSPDGKQMVSVGDDGAVLVWNVFID